ncbi:MAG: dihydrofolate reductase, partial [Chloroflexi bacterium]|nr:dihydrofolate reductase [Chloroflexota bacterium]
MHPKVSVYIATSLDGFIARPDGSLDWLEHDSGGEDYGFQEFFDSIDSM